MEGYLYLDVDRVINGHHYGIQRLETCLLGRGVVPEY
jgi:hypothetical protein